MNHCQMHQVRLYLLIGVLSFEGYADISKTKEKLSLAWHTFTLFSHKIESLLSGTPFKAPVTAINVLIDITEVCCFSKSIAC
jgi:hypothetical protein